MNTTLCTMTMQAASARGGAVAAVPRETRVTTMSVLPALSKEGGGVFNGRTTRFTDDF